MKITISETRSFHKLFGKLVGEDDRPRLHAFLVDNPEAGAVMPGASGLRKLRWARPGSGKRGGVRIIYYYYSKGAALYLFDVYAKSGQEDMSPAQLKELKKKIDNIKYGKME